MTDYVRSPVLQSHGRRVQADEEGGPRAV